MDLGSERLGVDSVKDNCEVVAVVHNDDSVEAVVVNGNDVDSSGSCVNERIGYQVDSRDLTGVRNQNGESLSCSPGVNSASPGASGGSVPKKGHGLKKWKRIKRGDKVANVSPVLDSGKAIKRNISGINNPSSQLSPPREENNGTSDILGPVNTLGSNLERISHFPAQASSSTMLAMGAVSENSEDRSSRSSTAASAPRHRIGMPSVSLISGDKKNPKNSSGKVINNSSQMGQPGKGPTDPSKKHRGGRGRVKYEKEISHSSLESDSRSSNFIFMRASNRRQCEASVNYNEESDEDIPGEPHFTDDQTAYSQADAREAGDISPRDSGIDFSWEGDEENDGNHQSPTRQDPLADSMFTLDSAMEALEKELQKLKEIGEESYVTCADTAVSPNSSEFLDGEDLAQDVRDSLNLAEKTTYLESKLEEARNALRIKELKVTELEDKLQSVSHRNGDTNNRTKEQEATKKLELELEILFAQKVEADVKYTATTSALQDAKHAVAKSETLLTEQKALAEEHLRLRTRLQQNESKVGKIKRQAKELETAVTFGSISKLTWYSLIQLLTLLIALWVVYLRMVSDSGVVVPT